MSKEKTLSWVFIITVLSWLLIQLPVYSHAPTLSDLKLDPSKAEPIEDVNGEWKVHMVVDIVHDHENSENDIAQVSDLTVDVSEVNGAVVIDSRKVDPSIDTGSTDEEDDDPGPNWPDDDGENNEYSNYPFSITVPKDQVHGCIEITASAKHGNNEWGSATWKGVLKDKHGSGSYYYFDFSNGASSFEFPSFKEGDSPGQLFEEKTFLSNIWQLHICACSKTTVKLNTSPLNKNISEDPNSSIPIEWAFWDSGDLKERSWESSWQDKRINIEPGWFGVINFQSKVIINKNGKLNKPGDYSTELVVNVRN